MKRGETNERKKVLGVAKMQKREEENKGWTRCRRGNGGKKTCSRGVHHVDEATGYTWRHICIEGRSGLGRWEKKRSDRAEASISNIQFNESGRGDPIKF